MTRVTKCYTKSLAWMDVLTQPKQRKGDMGLEIGTLGIRQRHRREDNFKINNKRIGCDGVDWLRIGLSGVFW